ncbi:conserved unknown protein [Ectocarpus siliculosus]|uniref:Uncharacterized protein n=1 Tax=Ectocarpus siliculosus TaxID=2880 RepID=D7FNR0_ECTSI|nr:conserved unknown protein [Ectocarpus siliculosus]|eukprot:CBJ26071.1 conserved unknown protein [Ectocarpus siliculosus]
MLERGWVTREEYQQLLHGDRLYSLHESEMEEQERERRRRLRNKIGLRRKLWRQTQIGVVRRARARKKAEKRNKAGGAAAAAADDLSKSGKVSTATSAAAAAAAAAAVDKRKKKKQPPAERPPDVCRDPITLDDLGSWTWDFRASEAATPPVSCGATKSTKHGGGGGWKGKRFGVGGKGGRGCGSGGSGGGGGSGSGSGVSGSGSGSGSTSSAVVTYNVESLVLYLLESGDFQEPTTRRPFSLVQLADLDALAAKAGAKVKGSLVQSYHEGQEKYVERRERREMLVGADRCLGDIVSEMLATIEDNDESHEDAHIYLCTLFPQFSHIFSEMKEADEEYARQCLEQHIALLRGPPNRPTAKSLSSEQGDLLTACVDFLSEQGSAGGGGDDGGGEGDSNATPPLGDGETAHGGSGGGDRRTVDEALASLLSEVAAATMVEGGSSTSSSRSSSSSDEDEEEEEEEEEEDACDLSLTGSVE